MEPATFTRRLERWMAPFAIPGIALYLIMGQAVITLLGSAQYMSLEPITLLPEKIMQGEIWRLFSFMFIPVTDSFLFLLIYWYVFWLLCSALERRWGIIRLNTFLFLGGLLTVLASFVTPEVPATNYYWLNTIFLAFAALFPEEEFLLYFVLPVKVKWLAILAWLHYALSLLGGHTQTRMLVIASIATFMCYFGPALFFKIKQWLRRRKFNP